MTPHIIAFILLCVHWWMYFWTQHRYAGRRGWKNARAAVIGTFLHLGGAVVALLWLVNWYLPAIGWR